MPENRNHDYGQQFKRAIENALSDGDFNGLNRLVEDALETTITGAMGQLKRFQSFSSSEDSFHASNGQNTGQSPHERGAKQSNQQQSYRQPRAAQSAVSNTAEDSSRQGARPYYMPYTNAKSATYIPWAEKVKSSPLFKKIGHVSGTLLQVFGGIGTGILGILLSIFGLYELVSGDHTVLSVNIWFLALMAFSIFMIVRGTGNKSRLARAQRYFQLCEKNGYCNISDLASAVAKDEKTVLKDLKKLIAKGVFPQGHIDEEQKCFMITDKAYAEYRTIAAQRRAQAFEELSKKGNAPEELTETEKQLQAMIAEGREYISLIREKNDAIPGEVFSQKLYRMEDLLKEIFLNLEKKPNQMSKMHRLMNYYLPTTLKLVSAYEEFDQMSAPGTDVTNAKKEIENTVDSINDAFSEILNKLFSDTAMDVTTDAQVLKTILAKDGLTKDNFTNQKEENEYVYELR